VVDLFINMDEFAKMGKTFGQTLSYIGSYYSYQSLAYFTELGGVIVVAAAAFSLARMNHTNELTAMLASGVSLYRVVWPILICAMILCGLIIIDRELVIPPVAHKLARKRDEVSGAKSFAIWLMDDENAAVWYSLEFNPSEQRMDEPMIIARNQEGREFGRIRGKEARPGSFNGRNGWIVQGAMIDPEESIGQNWGVTPTTEKVYTSLPPAVVRQKLPADGRSVQLSIVDPRYGGMKLEAAGRIDTRTAGIELTEPSFTFAVDGVQLGVILADSAVFEFAGGREGFWQLTGGRLFFASELAPEDLILRRAKRWQSYLSVAQLVRLLRMERTIDPDSVSLQIQTRLTEPINNVVMLLISLPFILSRERNIRASASLCLLMVGAFYVFIYISRYIGLPPTLASWLPILLFGPVAAVMLDAVKT